MDPTFFRRAALAAEDDTDEVGENPNPHSYKGVPGRLAGAERRRIPVKKRGLAARLAASAATTGDGDASADGEEAPPLHDDGVTEMSSAVGMFERQMEAGERAAKAAKKTACSVPRQPIISDQKSLPSGGSDLFRIDSDKSTQSVVVVPVGAAEEEAVKEEEEEEAGSKSDDDDDGGINDAEDGPDNSGGGARGGPRGAFIADAGGVNFQCTIDGCRNTCNTMYTRRYHTCREHIESLDVVKNGQNARFCQRCSSFHSIDAFEAYGPAHSWVH